MRRKKDSYFKTESSEPKPLSVSIKRRVNFSEVDALAIAWHGRYAEYFEEGWAHFGRTFGLSYENFLKAYVKAPIVQFHIDYFQSLFLEEEFTVVTSLVWSEGARLNMEYTILKEDKTLAAKGYSVQMFINADTDEIYFVMPKFIAEFRNKWKKGLLDNKK